MLSRELVDPPLAFSNACRDAFGFIQFSGFSPQYTRLLALAGFGLQRGVGSNGVGEIQRAWRRVAAVEFQRFDETALGFGPMLPLGVDVSKMTDGMSELEPIVRSP